MIRCCAWIVFLLFGAVGIVYACRGSVTGNVAEAAPDPGPLRVETRKDLGRAETGSDREVRFEFANASGGDVRILGAGGQCVVCGCVSVGNEFPVTVPPGGTYVLHATCHFVMPGHFNTRICVYTDSEAMGIVRLSVDADVVDP